MTLAPTQVIDVRAVETALVLTNDVELPMVLVGGADEIIG
jgi:hypothetical protein